MKYELPKLNYAYDALEPYIDARTMEIHHTRHHQGYIDKLNAVLEKYPEFADKKLENLLRELSSLPVEEADRTAIKNHGGGHLNHALFWQIMGPQKEADEKLAEEIKKTFGSVEEFKKVFTQTAASHFGSGWAWLARPSFEQNLGGRARDESEGLKVYSLPNQDSPYLKNHTPILGLDVWEHAYYLKYQNRRAEYIENWWSVLKLL